MRKLIVQVRVNEGQMRDANPHVPYAPEEIAQTVVECWRAGASVVHWHAREPKSGAISTDASLYVETARLIKRECDIVLFPTLGANALPTVQERIAHVVEDAGTRVGVARVGHQAQRVGAKQQRIAQETAAGEIAGEQHAAQAVVDAGVVVERYLRGVAGR